MKNLNLFLAISIIGLLCIGCEGKTRYMSQEVTFTLENRSDKMIRCVHNEDEFELVADGVDIVSISDTTYQTQYSDWTMLPYTPSKEFDPIPCIEKITIENLTDDTSYTYYADDMMYNEVAENDDEELFLNKYTVRVNEISKSNDNARYLFNLVVDDELLTILK